MVPSTRLRRLQQALGEIVSSLDADALEPAVADDLVGLFGAIERLGAAGKALCAGRVAASGAWLRAGDRSAADWLAKRDGTSVGAARSALQVAAHLAHAPATSEALRAGELSLTQAEAVTSAAAVDPTAETRLVALAGRQSVQKLRDECARVRAAAVPDAEERHRRIHRARFWRTWTDPEGGRRGTYLVTPEVGAAIEAAAKPFIDAAFEAARRAGDHEASEAYAADGLHAMAQAANGTASAVRRRRGEAIVIVNVESLRRGHAHGDELCEIPGVGPVPVPIARELLSDALLRVVIRDGIDIKTVVHAGRLASDAQRTAIQVRQHGRCARPSCRRPIAEIDHTRGFPVTGATTLDELAGLCKADHRLKTTEGHAYGRDPLGRIVWRRPDGTLESEHDGAEQKPAPPG